MRFLKFSRALIALPLIMGSFALLSGTAAAQTESTLYQFVLSSGEFPFGGVIFDANGNLYGTTNIAGAYQVGTVYKLSPGSGGTWTETVLHSFNINGKGGAYPFGTLIFDSVGNLYGTTSAGGQAGYGTAFELIPQSNGSWTEKVLHEFGQSSTDGQVPMTGLVFDAAGNLYGTTWSGGAYGFGVAFKLAPQAGGSWKETLLHSFGNGKDGQNPAASLILDASGNLYGTTTAGGNYKVGTAFELSPKSGGGWTERVIHEFGNSAADGQSPYGSLIFDASGNLYGTASGGGSPSVLSTAFELSPKVGGTWTETILHSFSGPDGEGPLANLIFDAAGNLYGTTNRGGTHDYGTVFEISPNGNGTWTERVLYSFFGESDGSYPRSGLVLDSAGNLDGTTAGLGNYSTVFQVTP
jgi:uncharacterized repeat protein (TIGR03803 family)